jgi:hypothetical protein
MSAFAKMHDINCMTVGKAALGANAAEEEHQACQITTLLENLANTLIQKMQQSTTSSPPMHNSRKPSRKCKQQWCANLLPAKRMPPPTSP